jgi:hypothetical protein
MCVLRRVQRSSSASNAPFRGKMPRVSKLEDALDAPMEDPQMWLWSLARAAKRKPKKVPERFEDLVIEGLVRAATALGEPKHGWGIGFARVADAGAKLLAIHPTERLARGVLGLAALSGIGGDTVKEVRKLKSRKAIAAALAELDRREAKAETYASMRKALIGFADEVFPRPKARAPKPAPEMLRLVDGKVIAPRASGPWSAYRNVARGSTRKGRDERRVVRPSEMTKTERKQLVGIFAKAFGLDAKSLSFDEIFSGKTDHDVLVESAQTPIEWWNVVDAKKKVRYQLWAYHADCGSLVHAGTAKRVAAIIQFGFGVEVKDPDHRLARAMEAAHADLRKRCPMSEIAGADFSVDDDDDDD